MGKLFGIITGLTIIFLVLLSDVTFAQSGLENLTETQIQALIGIKYNLATIDNLQEIGGTFFFLYLLEKYFELPWHKEGWAWATLGLAAILYLGSLVIRQYPQYFFL